jgi:peroxiredoxin Q/BCP
MRIQNSAVLMMAAVLGMAGLAVGDDAATQPALAMAGVQPKVGDTARDFTLKGLDDQPVQLSALLKDGPVVVVMLRGWVGYQCPICNRQVGALIAHAKEIVATGARVVMIYPGVADGLKEHAQEFVKDKTVPEKFYFLQDPDLAFVKDYGLRWDKAGETAYPSTFVMDGTGKVTFAKVSHSHGDRATVAEILAGLPKAP